MKNIFTFITLTLLLTFLTFGETKKYKVKFDGVKKMQASKILKTKKEVNKLTVSKMYNSIIRKANLAKIPVGCKAAYDRAVKAEFTQLYKCLEVIDAKWERFNNAQLVQLCKNKTMQQCYIEFAIAEKNKCSATIQNKIAELKTKYIQCLQNSISDVPLIR